MHGQLHTEQCEDIPAINRQVLGPKATQDRLRLPTMPSQASSKSGQVVLGCQQRPAFMLSVPRYGGRGRGWDGGYALEAFKARGPPI